MHWEASAPHMWSRRSCQNKPYVNQSRPRCTALRQGWVGAHHHTDNQLVRLYLNQRGFREVILSQVCLVDSRLRFGIRKLKCLQEGSWESRFITLNVCLKGKSQVGTWWDLHCTSLVLKPLVFIKCHFQSATEALKPFLYLEWQYLAP